MNGEDIFFEGISRYLKFEELESQSYCHPIILYLTAIRLCEYVGNLTLRIGSYVGVLSADLNIEIIWPDMIKKNDGNQSNIKYPTG